jgi:hypothetical protein
VFRVGDDLDNAGISVIVPEDGRGGKVRLIGTIANALTNVTKLAWRLAKEFWYEGGGGSYRYRQLVGLGGYCILAVRCSSGASPVIG